MPRLVPKHAPHPAAPAGVTAGDWPGPSGPYIEREPVAETTDVEYFVAVRPFTMGLRYFPVGSLVPADDEVATRIAAEHPDWLAPAVRTETRRAR
jgi:hypothetical protein